MVTKRDRSPRCSKHRSAYFKLRFPLKYSFNILRCRAAERGHRFELTYAEYERLARETGYDEKKGRTAGSLTIDRIDSDGPYAIGNIRVTIKSENSWKAARKMYVPYFQSLSESDKTEKTDNAPWTEIPTSNENEPF